MTTDASGQVVFAVPFTAPAGLPIITATATDPQGNTSEVSALRQGDPAGTRSGSSALVPSQSLIFSAASGDGIAIAGSRCRAARPGVEPDALGLGRDADALEHRRPDRLGRWDRIAVLQRSALGARTRRWRA